MICLGLFVAAVPAIAAAYVSIFADRIIGPPPCVLAAKFHSIRAQKNFLGAPLRSES